MGSKWRTVVVASLRFANATSMVAAVASYDHRIRLLWRAICRMRPFKPVARALVEAFFRSSHECEQVAVPETAALPSPLPVILYSTS